MTEDLLTEVQRMLGELGSKVAGIERRLSAENFDTIDERLTELKAELVATDERLCEQWADESKRIDELERRPAPQSHAALDRSALWLEVYSGTFQALVANHWTNNSAHSLAELETLARATANLQHGER